MSFLLIHPEVGGNFGQNTILERIDNKIIVYRLHYHFDGWLGDCLQESFPCFIITEQALASLSDLSGFIVEDVEVTQSLEFDQMFPNVILPNFKWIKIIGVAGRDHFGLSPKGNLVVSLRAYNLLKEFGLSHAEPIDVFPAYLSCKYLTPSLPIKV